MSGLGELLAENHSPSLLEVKFDFQLVPNQKKSFQDCISRVISLEADPWATLFLRSARAFRLVAPVVVVLPEVLAGDLPGDGAEAPGIESNPVWLMYFSGIGSAVETVTIPNSRRYRWRPRFPATKTP